MPNPFLVAVQRCDGPTIPRLVMLFRVRAAMRTRGVLAPATHREHALESGAVSFPLDHESVTKLMIAFHSRGMVAGNPPRLSAEALAELAAIDAMGPL